eukprot:10797503-Ditylum_brightwellii.AAC.1
MAHETMKWMEDEGILKHWILREIKLNKGASYENHVPGNSPEYNALDSNINRDIHCAAFEHVSHTTLLPQIDKQKFLVSTVKRQEFPVQSGVFKI